MVSFIILGSMLTSNNSSVQAIQAQELAHDTRIESLDENNIQMQSSPAVSSIDLIIKSSDTRKQMPRC